MANSLGSIIDDYASQNWNPRFAMAGNLINATFESAQNLDLDFITGGFDIDDVGPYRSFVG